jgi:hypothetical protein
MKSKARTMLYPRLQPGALKEASFPMLLRLHSQFHLIKSEIETKIYFDIRVITKLPNSEQSYKGKVKTHNYINRQNQSTTGKL